MLAIIGPALGQQIQRGGPTSPKFTIVGVVGVFRPVILIPLGVLNDLTPQQVEEKAKRLIKAYLSGLLDA